MTGHAENIPARALNCLRQQSELYGDELYLRDGNQWMKQLRNASGHHWTDLETRIVHCKKCGLSAARKHAVPGCGSRQARLMLIGEAPGEEEDIRGKPFVGKAGQLLDKILAAIEFDRDEVYIANILKCRPPQNRDPHPEEIACCLPYLWQQIDLIRPGLILALGRIAGQTLLESDDSLGKLRSDVHQYRSTPLMVTYHPAALLRHPEWKKPVWEDVQQLRRYYDQYIGDKRPWNPPGK